MSRFLHAILHGIAFLGLSACGASSAPAPAVAPVANPVAPHDDLSRIVARYWDERVFPGKAQSPQFMADSLAVERRHLAEVAAIPRASLDADARLNYDIFKRQRELDVEGFTYPIELIPIDPFDGPPLQLARAAADSGQFPFKSVKDYENWLLRIDDYVAWTNQAIENMREGLRRGYTSPRALVERMLPLLQGFGEDGSANVFYVPWRGMPKDFPESERTRLSWRLNSAIKDKLLPAFRELHDFLQREYLPRARLSVALSVLPLGPAWYAYRVKRATGTALTPDEIHSIGLAEVDRGRARLNSLSPAAPSSAGGLMSGYQDLKAQTLAALPTLFAALPRADFELRDAVPFGGSANPLVYQPAVARRGVPAILYVNSAALPRVEVASFLQEAIPGRHYQSALQQERTDLPKFRQFGNEPAFVDGWALYAASLGEELGLYRDDEAKRGAVIGQLRCAAALVVDTGLHAKSWTRTQAIDYLRSKLAVNDADAGFMTDRLVASPGDALACKIGELKIQSLRNRAQQTMGTRFDIREFHSEILRGGAMPLDILEARIKLWMEARP
jgi:uncharacterized protein (DUF885 family)